MDNQKYLIHFAKADGAQFEFSVYANDLFDVESRAKMLAKKNNWKYLYFDLAEEVAEY